MITLNDLRHGMLLFADRPDVLGDRGPRWWCVCGGSLVDIVTGAPLSTELYFDSLRVQMHVAAPPAIELRDSEQRYDALTAAALDEATRTMEAVA